MNKPHFLPFQEKWLKDKSIVKVWEKSRRVGATYTQSYEDVTDILRGSVPAVWFSSADETAAKEYILYCRQWAEMFSLANNNERVLKSKTNTNRLQIVFANGGRITALSSNPKNFRSKGGKVVLDEFAHHDQDDELWKAAKPAASWGYPVRILSTHNGKQCLFYRFTREIAEGALPWSLHKTDIHTAVAQGLVDTIKNRIASEAERQDFLLQLRKSCFDETVWGEEFCCIPIDEATAFLPYPVIRACEDERALTEGVLQYSGDLYAGIDIARKNDLSVIYVLEQTGEVLITKIIRVLKNETFSRQRQTIFDLLQHPKMRRCAIDATGLGMQLAEDCVHTFGAGKIDAVQFTAKRKEEMAYLVKRHFENGTILIPDNDELRADLHSVHRVVSVTGSIRFDASRAETGSHADRFWALALALSAADEPVTDITPRSRYFRPKSKILQGYR